jgi:N-acetyl-gamma-glutamyl-phosphate reductase
MLNKIDVAIVGATGYTGLELIKILHMHPIFCITYIANSQGKTTIDKLHPCLDGIINIDVKKVDTIEIKKVASLVFLALPHKTSMSFTKELLNLGLKVVDLSADYRLELNTYEKTYCLHEDKNNLKNAVYGMPEFYKNDIRNTNLIANPGCYPTASILALMPFIPYIKDNASVFIDAKSGISGAGKKLSETTSFVNISENMFSYNVFKHRHTPEIVEKIKLITNKDLKINFVPHLIPITRGMLISIYVSLNKSINAKKVLEEFYENNYFVRISSSPVNIKNTSGTNFCDIYVEQNDNDLFISSSIDNLLRGASSAAVVNANIMCGLEENLAIPIIAYAP